MKYGYYRHDFEVSYETSLYPPTVWATCIHCGERGESIIATLDSPHMDDKVIDRGFLHANGCLLIKASTKAKDMHEHDKRMRHMLAQRRHRAKQKARGRVV